MNITRYLRICKWARFRYTIDGVLPWSYGNEPAAFARIERAASAKYLNTQA
jgi:hypothetical protein